MKHELDTREKLFNNHFDFQGGILQYHQYITALSGGLLFLLAFSFDQGAWIYFYLLGMFKIVKDTVKTSRLSSSHKLWDVNTTPLVYYLLSALIVTVIMAEAGHQFPDLTLGLAANTVEVLT